MFDVALADEEEDKNVHSMHEAIVELPRSSSTKRRSRQIFKTPPQEEDINSSSTTNYTHQYCTMVAANIHTTTTMDDGTTWPMVDGTTIPLDAATTSPCNLANEGPTMKQESEARATKTTKEGNRGKTWMQGEYKGGTRTW